MRDGTSTDPGDDLTGWGAARLSEAIHRREVSCRQVMQAHLDRIDARNAELNAIVSRRDREVLEDEASQRDEELAQGRSRGWMHGLPQAIKDAEPTAGLRTTLGSPLYADWIPSTDSLVVARMKAAGCIVIGKTNLPEFGLGSHTFNEVFGVTRNPYDTTRSAGGSSGGAAVALATRMLPVADGSDYMGSLRNPAAWCNVFGFRPSQGRVPTWPAADAYISQLSTAGPMGRSVLDLTLLLATQAGYDARAPLSLDGDLGVPPTVAGARDALDGREGPLRVGWLGDLDGYLTMEDGVLAACADGLQRIESLGGVVEPVVFDIAPEKVWDAWLVWRALIIAARIAAAAPTPEQQALVKPEARWELERGLGLDGGQIVRAAQTRTAYFHSVSALFERFDLLALPSAQVWPFAADLRWPERIGDREMDTYHRWMEVALYATFAGLPAISVPVGFDPRGLPMGMQLVGPPRRDLDVLRAAHAYEATIADLRVGAA